MAGNDGAAPLRLGVLGGMGPAAAVDFLGKLVASTPAGRDQDHIPVILCNLPQIPDRSRAILADGDCPSAAMRAGIDLLEKAGADFIAIPCNTAHHWFDTLAAATTKPIVHIADAVIAALPASGGLSIAILGTRGTARSNIYGARLAARGHRLHPLAEHDQAIVDRVIAGVKAQRPGDGALDRLVADLIARGADRVVLACTELPLAMRSGRASPAILDATLLLAQACVSRALRGALG